MQRFSVRNVLLILCLAFLSLCGALWFLHPRYLTREINKRLAQIPGYNGEVAKARVGFAGTLIIKQFRIDKNEEKAPAAFISADTIILDLSWRHLLKKNLVGTIKLQNPKSLFLMRQRKPGQARKFALWQPYFATFPSFRINRIKIVNGSLRVRNDEDIPPTDLYFDQINAEGTNLTNRPQLLLSSSTRVRGMGRMMNEAPLTVDVEVNPFQEHAAFKLKGKLERFNLTRLNPVLRYYTGVDLEKGYATIEGKFSAGEGHFTGRVHRKCEELDILGKTDTHLTFIQAAKEFIFEKWIKGKKDKDSGNLEADYDLSGPLGYMDQDIFLATVWVGKSAFLQSLRPTLPEAVKMGSPEQAEEEWMELQARERKKIRR